MSRSKRVRKARMATRQVKRHEATIKRCYAFLVEQRERTQMRRELNASDMPDAVKTVFGALVDPAGFAHELIVKEMKRWAEERQRTMRIEDVIEETVASK